MGVKNWLGQELNIGDLVYNARRDGNSTTMRVGRIKKFNDAKGTVQVEWVSYPSGRKIYDDETRSWQEVTGKEHYVGFNLPGDYRYSVGSNDPDALVKPEDSSGLSHIRELLDKYHPL